MKDYNLYLVEISVILDETHYSNSSAQTKF